jgi:regulator of replication initiation timing
MNFVGKILTVLILVMSIAFLIVSVMLFQTHRDWRQVALDNKKKIDQLTQANQALQSEIQISRDRLAHETVARRFAIAALQTKADQVEAQLQSSVQQVASLQAQAGTMATQIDATSQLVKNSLDENSKLRTNLRDTQQNRDQAFDRVVQLTDTLNSSQGNIQTLEERQQELIASNGRMRDVLTKNDLTEFTSVEGTPPQVDGVVTAVGQKDLIEISIGHDDGLKVGHTLEVYSKNTYLGRVMVRKTYPDRSVVQIIPEFRKGIIRKGDRVATKLG